MSIGASFDRSMAFLQRHFWLPMLIALVAGMVVPGIGESLKPTFKPALIIILSLVFAKIDMLEVLHHIRNPRLMIWLLGLQLVVLPLLLYVVLLPVAPSVAVGVLLLAAAPPAASAPVFCDLVDGNTPLCVSVYILSYLIVPISLTLVMGVVGLPDLNLLGLFRSVTLLIFVPLIGAQLVKRWWPRLIARTQHHYAGINLLVITYLIFAVVSALATRMGTDIGHIIMVVAILYAVFTALHLAGYWMIFWRPARDRLAISVSTAYMNTALAVVLAIDFFPPEVVLVAVASEIPWSTMLAPLRLIHNRFSKAPQAA